MKTKKKRRFIELESSYFCLCQDMYICLQVQRINMQRMMWSRTLLLGSDAVRFVRNQLQMKLEEITQWNKVSNSTDFDSQITI